MHTFDREGAWDPEFPAYKRRSGLPRGTICPPTAAALLLIHSTFPLGICLPDIAWHRDDLTGLAHVKIASTWLVEAHL
jgi:hypothetical protein